MRVKQDDCCYVKSVGEIQENRDVCVVYHGLNLNLINLPTRVARCACGCPKCLLCYPKGVAKLTFVKKEIEL
jgi:hypothetical protein